MTVPDQVLTIRKAIRRVARLRERSQRPRARVHAREPDGEHGDANDGVDEVWWVSGVDDDAEVGDEGRQEKRRMEDGRDAKERRRRREAKEVKVVKWIGRIGQKSSWTKGAAKLTVDARDVSAHEGDDERRSGGAGAG